MNRGWLLVLALAVGGCSTQPKKEADVQQPQTASITQTTPQTSSAAGQSPAEAVPKVGAITVSIVDTDTIASRVASGAVQIDFLVDGTGADLVTLLCREGEVPDVWRSAYKPCSGTKSQTVSNLVTGHSYAIGVVAQNPESGQMTDEVSATFTVTLSATASSTGEGSSPLLMRQVGAIWKVYIPSNMYIQGYTTDSGLNGGVDLYEAKDDQGSFIQACTDFGAKVHEEIAMKDSMGTQRTYCHMNLDYTDFNTYTENRLGLNYLTITTPLSSLSTPGFDSQGHFTGFSRLVVNAFDSRALGGAFNSDFNSKVDLFMKLCSGNQSTFVQTDLPSSLVRTGRTAQMRVCRTNIDFGLGLGSKDVWMAQILAVDSNQEIDTEIVYMTQWESAMTAGSFADSAYKIIWTYFQPVDVYFQNNAVPVPANLPAPSGTGSAVPGGISAMPVIGVPPYLGTI